MFRLSPLVLLLACETAPEETPPTEDGSVVLYSAADAEAECELEGGSDCAAAAYLTRDAAFCLASLEGLSEGIEDWAAGLTYHHQYGTVVWNVISTEVAEAGYSAGETLTFHATTGERLGRSSWEATP